MMRVKEVAATDLKETLWYHEVSVRVASYVQEKKDGLILVS